MQISAILAGQVTRRRIKIGEHFGSLRWIAQLNNMSLRGMAKAFTNLAKNKIVGVESNFGYRVGGQVLAQQEKIFSTQLQNLVIMALQMELEEDELLKAVTKTFAQHEPKYLEAEKIILWFK